MQVRTPDVVVTRQIEFFNFYGRKAPSDMSNFLFLRMMCQICC